MLLITDRPNDALHLERTLSQIQPCNVIALHQVAASPVTPSIVICDVELTNTASMEMFRTAITRYGAATKTRVLCLTRSDAHFSSIRGLANGAVVLSPETPQATVIDTVKQILRTAETEAAIATGRVSVQACADKAGQVLVGLFEAVRRSQPATIAHLERGGDAVMAAVGQSRIRAWLDVVWNYDNNTYQHCLLVAGLTAAFAVRLGLSHKNQRFLSQAALLHDIGKARVPLAILNKPGKFTDAEMTVMRDHTTIGADMLRGQRAIDRQFREIVRSHHEYLDGSGYPDGLRGEQISNFLRIVTICDIYGALIERRTYKPPMPSEQALAELQAMGPKLDGGLVAAFGGMIRAARHVGAEHDLLNS